MATPALLASIGLNTDGESRLTFNRLQVKSRYYSGRCRSLGAFLRWVFIHALVLTSLCPLVICLSFLVTNIKKTKQTRRLISMLERGERDNMCSSTWYIIAGIQNAVASSVLS